MFFSPGIHRAINIAAWFHKDQRRKSNDLPYIVHPFSVFLILSKYTKDEDTLCASLLHDVLEDTEGYSLEQMVVDFNENVGNLVKTVSEKKGYFRESDLTWKELKEGYLSNIKEACENALLISAADKIHNITTKLDKFEKNTDIWSGSEVSVEEKFWFYEELLKIFKEKLKGHEIVKEYESLLAKLRGIS